jgi:CRP-like cAMP-binding protein
MVRLRVREEAVAANAPLVLYACGRLFLEEAHCLSDGQRLDPASVLIATTVAIGAIERGMKNGGTMKPMSRRAIASATGLPRETVRRRVDRLVEGGLLRIVRGGVLPPAEGAGSEPLYRLASSLVKAAGLLLAEGVVDAETCPAR